MQRRCASHFRALGLWLLAVCVSSQANDFTMKTLDRVSDPNARELVIGGKKAEPADWPATFVLQQPSTRPCSSTAVGRRVILTAAHCVTNGARGIVEVGGARIPVTCRHHPAYRGDSSVQYEVSADFALCHLDNNLPGAVFERISVDSALLALGTTIRLLGFGCTKDFGADHRFGTLYEGDAPVSSLPRDQNYYLITSGDAAVCFGDSGGSAYLKESTGRRFVVAVNSRSDYQRESWLSATGLRGFETWARQWSNERSVKICGIHPEAEGCRAQ